MRNIIFHLRDKVLVRTLWQALPVILIAAGLLFNSSVNAQTSVTCSVHGAYYIGVRGIGDGVDNDDVYLEWPLTVNFTISGASPSGNITVELTQIPEGKVSCLLRKKPTDAGHGTLDFGTMEDGESASFIVKPELYISGRTGTYRAFAKIKEAGKNKALDSVELIVAYYKTQTVNKLEDNLTDGGENGAWSTPGYLRYALKQAKGQTTSEGVLIYVDPALRGDTIALVGAITSRNTDGSGAIGCPMFFEGNGITLDAKDVGSTLFIIDNDAPTLTDVAFDKVHFANAASAGSEEGGAINNKENLILTSCIFSGNTSTTNGAAVYSASQGMYPNLLTVRGCTFYNNVSGSTISSIYCPPTGNLFLEGNIFFSDGKAIKYDNKLENYGYNYFDVSTTPGYTLSALDEHTWTGSIPFDDTTFIPLAPHSECMGTVPDDIFPFEDFYGAKRPSYVQAQGSAAGAVASAYAFAVTPASYDFDADSVGYIDANNELITVINNNGTNTSIKLKGERSYNFKLLENGQPSTHFTFQIRAGGSNNFNTFVADGGYSYFPIFPMPDLAIGHYEATLKVTLHDGSGLPFTAPVTFDVLPSLWVTNTSDDLYTEGSLRWALTQANLYPTGCIITVHPSLRGQTITIDSELPAINNNVTLEGNGIRIFADKKCGIMTVNHGSTSLIKRVLFDSGYNTQNGGAIVNTGHLTLATCIFNNNTSTGAGGAIYSGPYKTSPLEGQDENSLTVVACTFYKNYSERYGAIANANSSAPVTLLGNLFLENTSNSGPMVGSPVNTAGYNATDRVSCNNTVNCSGWIQGSNDVYNLTGISLNNKTFIPDKNSTAIKIVPVGTFPDIAALDFYGVERSASDPTCAGAVADFYGLVFDKDSYSCGREATGYTPPSVTATVTNESSLPSGEMKLSLVGANSDAFILSPSSHASIAVDGTASFTITPVADLAAGTYTATIFMQRADGTGAYYTADVDFTVIPTLRVTNTSDDATVEGSLRWALTEADKEEYDNQTEPVHILVDDALKGETIFIGSELPEVSNLIVLEGNGITIDAQGKCRIMSFDAEEDAEILINRVHFANGKADDFGGAACNYCDNGYNAKVTFQSCIFSGNSAGEYGGAVCNCQAGTTTVFYLCTFYQNTATSGGGAIANSEDFGGLFQLSVNGCLFFDNSSVGGVAAHNQSSSASILSMYSVMDVSSSESGVYDSYGTVFDYPDIPFNTKTFVPLEQYLSDVSIIPYNEYWAEGVPDFYGMARPASSSSTANIAAGAVMADYGFRVEPDPVTMTAYLGYTPTEVAQQMTVYNEGSTVRTLSATLKGADAANFTLDNIQPNSIAASTGTGIFNVTPVSGLAVGVYTANIRIANTDGTGSVLVVPVTLNVVQSIVVTNTGDDATVEGSLRWALTEAAKPVYADGVVISVDETLTGDTITIGSRLPDVVNPVIIAGNGIIIDANKIAASGATGILSATADLTIRRTAFISGNSTGDGGAVHSSAKLTVESCIFADNTAVNGGAIWCSDALTVNGCTFYNNHASTVGGAIMSTGFIEPNGNLFFGNDKTGGIINAATPPGSGYFNVMDATDAAEAGIDITRFVSVVERTFNKFNFRPFSTKINDITVVINGSLIADIVDFNGKRRSAIYAGQSSPAGAAITTKSASLGFDPASVEYNGQAQPVTIYAVDAETGDALPNYPLDLVTVYYDGQIASATCPVEAGIYPITVDVEESFFSEPETNWDLGDYEIHRKTVVPIIFELEEMYPFTDEENSVFPLEAQCDAPVTIKYRIDAGADITYIDADNNMHLTGEGHITITAYIDDPDYAGEATASTESVYAFKHAINVPGALNAAAGKYVLECDAVTATVTLTFDYLFGFEIVSDDVTLPAWEQLSPGVYTCTFDIADVPLELKYTIFCGAASMSESLTLTPRIPFENIGGIKWGNVIFVNNNPATNGGYSFIGYQWYRDGTPIGTGQFYSAGDNGEQLSGEYTVTAIYSDNEALSTCAADLSKSKAATLKAYPNPTNGVIYVENAADDVEIAKMTGIETFKTGDVLELFDLNGKLVLTCSVNGDITSLDLSALPAGSYFIRVKGKSETVKIIKN